MLDPRELYDVHDASVSLGAPVLVHAMSGFMDAGHAGVGLTSHLLSTLPSERLITFDADQLIDYRSRRPTMGFDTNRWTEYDRPELVIDIVRDLAGTPFLLLHGCEPDVQWERFVAAVLDIVDDHEVGLTIGVHGIPMAVPHTRPLTTTAHATRPELIADEPAWFGGAQIPGSAAALMELRLGDAGHDAMGYAVHVPHYLAQTSFPQASEKLLTRVEMVTGLDLPTEALSMAGVEALEEIERQVADAAEIAQVVSALERQYDSFMESRERQGLLAEPHDIPSADEIGAEIERFLAAQDDQS